MRIFLITVFLCTFCAISHAQDTFQVYFPLNSDRAEKDQYDHIDRLIFLDTLIHGQKFIILGYADYLGADRYNKKLSYSRAQNVRNYLAQQGFTAGDIKICIGKGKISHTGIQSKDGRADDRKVLIIIDHSEPVATSSPPITFSTPANKVVTKLTRDVGVNDVVALNILFEPGTDSIRVDSHEELKQLLDFMGSGKTTKICIEGHICCIPWKPGFTTLPDTGVYSLSYKRALAVGNFLVRNKIDPHRITYKGVGQLDPFAIPEVTPADQAMNRRVGIRIVNK